MKTLITQREGTDKYGVPVDSLESNYIRYPILYPEQAISLIRMSSYSF